MDHQCWGTTVVQLEAQTGEQPFTAFDANQTPERFQDELDNLKARRDSIKDTGPFSEHSKRENRLDEFL